MRSSPPVAHRAPYARSHQSHGPRISPLAGSRRRTPRLLALGLLVVGIVATAVIVWLHASGRPDGEAGSPARGPIRLVADGALVRRLPDALAGAPVDRLKRELDLPSRMVDVRGPARITFDIDVGSTARRIVRAGRTPTVEVARRPVASTIAVPRRPVRWAGTEVERALATLVGTEGGRTLEGAGVRLAEDASPGGIVRAVARAGLVVRDLTGVAPARLYDELLQGRPVMVWVAASAAPRQPSSRAAGAATDARPVVLHGVDSGGAVRVLDARGARDTWSQGRFEGRWERALSGALGV